jgi:hypothetical protein
VVSERFDGEGEIFEKRPIGIGFAIRYGGVAWVATGSTGRPRSRQA